MKKKRTYNTRLIRDDYSYYVEQVADLFSVDVATVRRWIRDEGLKRIPKVRPHIIHSSELKAFLDRKRTKRKKPCAPNEVFCLPCQSPRTPRMGSAVVTSLPNGIIRFKAKCSECDCIIYRNIRGVEWASNHPLAVFLRDASEQHKGAEAMHRECPLRLGEG